jgi:hypothetical protein
MPTRKTKKQISRQDKAKVIAQFGTFTAAARELGCSTEAIRLAFVSPNRCPRVRAKLDAALA